MKTWIPRDYRGKGKSSRWRGVVENDVPSAFSVDAGEKKVGGSNLWAYRMVMKLDHSTHFLYLSPNKQVPLPTMTILSLRSGVDFGRGEQASSMTSVDLAVT